MDRADARASRGLSLATCDRIWLTATVQYGTVLYVYNIDVTLLLLHFSAQGSDTLSERVWALASPV